MYDIVHDVPESPETVEELPSEPIKPVFEEQDLNTLVGEIYSDAFLYIFYEFWVSFELIIILLQDNIVNIYRRNCRVFLWKF